MNVNELLEAAYNGAIVLPDFQRSFIWEPEDVRELLVSVLGDYFIGSMLVLECYKDDSPFALRLIEGVEEVHPEAGIQSIVKILLDGQQRTTALFYAVYEPDIPLKNRRSPYRFFVNLDKALSKNWDEAVIGVNVNDRKKMAEVTKDDRVISFSLLTKIGKLAAKFRDDSRFEEILELANNFMNREIHIITLPRGTDLEKIVETFERINRTGRPLSIFELLTAGLYRFGIKLPKLLEEARKTYEFTRYVQPEFILKEIALLRDKEPKRRNILDLEPDGFERDWDRACAALENAYHRATDIRDGYGVLDFTKWMPYSTMLVPLGAMLEYLTTHRLEAKVNYEKIDRWYWASVFSNRYDQAVDSTSWHDLNVVKSWIRNDSMVPDFIKNFDAKAVDLDVDKQSAAVYRGVMNLIVLAGAIDFESGKPPQFGKEVLQDDHIFPKSIFKEHRIPNRTLISTNSRKGNAKPSVYFKKRMEELGESQLKDILESHIIPPSALSYLLQDRLEDFLDVRGQAIVEHIRKKVGATI